MDTPKGMRPFNLQEALNGAKVVTREGNEVTELRESENLESPFRLIGVYEGAPHMWRKDGRYLSIETEDGYDLFLAPKTRTVWYGLIRGYGAGIYLSGLFKSKRELEGSAEMNQILAIHSLEVEE